MRVALIIIPTLVVLAFTPTADAKKFANCTALNKAYKGGVAKTKTAQQKAIGVAPFSWTRGVWGLIMPAPARLVQSARS